MRTISKLLFVILYVLRRKMMITNTACFVSCRTNDLIANDKIRTEYGKLVVVSKRCKSRLKELGNDKSRDNSKKTSCLTTTTNKQIQGFPNKF